MFEGIYNLIANIIRDLSFYTMLLLNNVFSINSKGGMEFDDYDFNLTLFSDNPIISINMYDLLLMFFIIFYSMFFIILLYKVTKKFINMVFGVFKV